MLRQFSQVLGAKELSLRTRQDLPVKKFPGGKAIDPEKNTRRGRRGKKPPSSLHQSEKSIFFHAVRLTDDQREGSVTVTQAPHHILDDSKVFMGGKFDSKSLKDSRGVHM